MQTKLTLRLDDALICRAKAYAEERDKSLSQIVADYFVVLTEEKPAASELPPITSAMKGLLRGTDLSEEDYRSWLEAKNR